MSHSRYRIALPPHALLHELRGVLFAFAAIMVGLGMSMVCLGGAALATLPFFPLVWRSSASPAEASA